MAILAAMSGTFLLLNLLGVLIALGVGFAVGAWYMSARYAAAQESQATTSARDIAQQALMASGRLADLAKCVAADVGDHSSKMRAISEELRAIDSKSDDANSTISQALDKILTANATLHERLERAERQIESQAAEIRLHESEARTDSLTSLANRRAFDDELKRRLAEWERIRTPVSLILIDIDHFKRFNDTHGHQVGDEVLRQVAKVLVAQSRDMDVPCRYGGEEFAVILPATTATDARNVAERIRKAVEQSTTHCNGRALKVTASLGLAAAGHGEESPSLIRRADESLYRSKEAGRNCGHWHDLKTIRPVHEDHAPTDSAHGSEGKEKPASPPTHVTSRATFIQELKRRVIESHRFGVPVSTIHLMFEDFERISRSHGHAATQQMLGRATQALESVLRETDLLAQKEQGEFVIMLPGSTAAEAHQMAKRMRITASNYVVELGDGRLPIRFRHGIAELKPGETAQELLARGRQAMMASGTIEASPLA